MRKGAVIFLTGLLALSSLPSMAGDSPSVQVGFSPEGSAQTLVIGAIDSAQSSIRMMAYSFTAMDIMQALVKAKNRGVDVKIVIDERGNRNDVSHRAMKFIVDQREHLNRTLRFCPFGMLNTVRFAINKVSSIG